MLKGGVEPGSACVERALMRWRAGTEVRVGGEWWETRAQSTTNGKQYLL
jgi:hypothetical protein